MDLARIQLVLVRTPNWLGDAVMAVPALRGLRKMFEHARLTIVVKRSMFDLYEGEGLADDILLTDGAALGKMFYEARALRKTRWDLAVLLQNAFSAAVLARVAGARHIAGYPTDGRRILLNHVVSLGPAHKQQHQVFYYLNIVRRLEELLSLEVSPDQFDPNPRLNASAEDLLAGLRVLNEAGVVVNTVKDSAHVTAIQRASQGPALIKNPSNSNPIVTLNPGATNSRAKRWPVERFAAVADRLAELTGSRTIIIGTEGDREVALQVASAMKTPAAMLAGKTSIGALKGALAYCDVVISNDTGAAHLGAALKVPTIVVFGPTEHFATRPFSDDAEVIRQPVDCSPCMLRDCPIDHRCMTGVSVERVTEAALKKIGGQTIRLA